MGLTLGTVFSNEQNEPMRRCIATISVVGTEEEREIDEMPRLKEKTAGSLPQVDLVDDDYESQSDSDSEELDKIEAIRGRAK